MIRNIVALNRDIKVWNLSLGSKLEIKPNFISPEAAELDRIQSEYDVIFVVAGTNRSDGETKKDMRIGSPADSLNSLVVNAVDFRGKSASYTRVGPVLSFFISLISVIMAETVPVILIKWLYVVMNWVRHM